MSWLWLMPLGSAVLATLLLSVVVRRLQREAEALRETTVALERTRRRRLGDPGES